MGLHSVPVISVSDDQMPSLVSVNTYIHVHIPIHKHTCTQLRIKSSKGEKFQVITDLTKEQGKYKNHSNIVPWKEYYSGFLKWANIGF